MAVKLPHIPRGNQIAIDALRADRLANPRPLSPCVDQTETDVAAFYRSASAGDHAVVRHTQGGRLVYEVREIEDTNPERGRVFVRGSGAFYAKSGKNCFHPKGQTRLVVPTPEVLAWALEHPQGKHDVAYWCEGGKGLL